MKPLTDTQKRNISRNVIAACKDINKLNKTGYNFLYLCSGFIAHYNLDGFKDYYSEPGSLQRDLENNARWNQWRNFGPEDENAAYYHGKRDVYNMILGSFCADQFVRDHFQFIIVKG